MRVSHRQCRVGALLAILLHPETTAALSFRNHFTAAWSEMGSGNTANSQFGSSKTHLDEFDSSTAESDYGAEGTTAQSRHQVNGVVTLTNGSYGFTYRPIAGECTGAASGWIRTCPSSEALK